MISTRSGWRRVPGPQCLLVPSSPAAVAHDLASLLTYMVSTFMSIFPPVVSSLKTVPQLYLFTGAPRLTMGLLTDKLTANIINVLNTPELPNIVA